MHGPQIQKREDCKVRKVRSHEWKDCKVYEEWQVWKRY